MRPCSSSATGQSSVSGQSCKLGDTSSSQQNCQAVLHQALHAFLYKREASLPLSGSTQSNRYAKILALKSLKIWCSLSINNRRLPAPSSCTSTFPQCSYADPPVPTLSLALRSDRRANKKASCHGILSPYRQMSIKNQVSLRFASQSSFQLLLPAREEFPLCPFTSDGSMRFGINPGGLEGNYYRTGTGTFKGQV